MKVLLAQKQMAPANWSWELGGMYCMQEVSASERLVPGAVVVLVMDGDSDRALSYLSAPLRVESGEQLVSREWREATEHYIPTFRI